MPTYNYRCDACESEFEKEQRISEPAIRKCPSCGKLKVRRMISSGNFILKGGGWYSDGYGKPSNSKKSETTTESSSTESSSKAEPAKPSSSGDSKPASEPSKPGAAAAS